jgi:two-component system, OmpR family, KDP operon response regulator KdpE
MKVLVIDDDEYIREAVSVTLSVQWPDCEILCAQDGDSGLQTFYQESPDAMVLDVGLPGTNGFEVLSRVRESSAVPVLMLSARDGEADKVRALELGADDYVTKPCSYLELTARIKAVLRRAEANLAASASSQVFSCDGLTIHFPSQHVEVDGRTVSLTNTEYRLLYHLVRNAGRVVTHRALLRQAWGSESYGADVVRVYVSRLRAKLESDRDQPRFILTKPGVGYLFAGNAVTGANGSGGDGRESRGNRISIMPPSDMKPLSTPWQQLEASSVRAFS